jgi:hypothetical protein
LGRPTMATSGRAMMRSLLGNAHQDTLVSDRTKEPQNAVLARMATAGTAPEWLATPEARVV